MLIELLVFDISTKKTRYGNGIRRISTLAFEMKFYPQYTADLKNFFCHILASNNMVLNNKTIRFVAYGLLQYTTSDLYRSQIIKEKNYFHNIIIISLSDIDSNTMYHELIAELPTILIIKFIEEYFLTQSIEALILTTTQLFKLNWKLITLLKKERFQIFSPSQILTQ